ncbi:unnamed protein product, partial [Closterium sp. NIES-53]
PLRVWPLGPLGLSAPATAAAATAAAATAAPACNATMALLRVLAFDHEGRPVQFDTWLDDLQLYLLSDSKDSVSLFDLASGAATAPPATADSATRSQWLTRDTAARLAIRNNLPLAECAHFGQHKTAQALYDAVVTRYSSPVTAALGQLLLPYLLPELSAFATAEDLVSHLRTSDARYRATVPAEFLDRNQPPMFITLYFIVTRLPDSLRSVRDHFLSLDPTSLTVDLLEQHLLAAETSAVAVGAARGTPRPPFFEGCSPSPLAPSYASAAAADISIAEDVGAASASAKRRSSKGKGGRGGGGGSGGGGGGSRSGGGGSSGGSGGGGGAAAAAAASERDPVAPAAPIAIFDLDFDAILSAMYALSFSAEGDCYRCVPPDPGIAAVALGASESGTLPGTAPAQALHTFTLDFGASRCFFRDSTTLTPLLAPVPIRLADPSGAPVVARSSTLLPCLAVPSGSLSGLHLPSFSTNFVSTSGQVAVSCSCHLLSHQTLLWHHHLGHPSLPRLCGMHSRLLVSCLPRSLPPLPPSPAPPCLPCVKGRQRATPHSSSFPPTTAPLQTLHMDVWGPARVSGQGRERYFLLVVDDYTRYTTVFPLLSKGEVVDVLIPWIRIVRLQLRERFGKDLPVFAFTLRQRCERSSGVSLVDPLPCTAPVEVTVGSGAAPGTVSGGAASVGVEPGVAAAVTASLPMPAPSTYSEQSGGLTKRRAPASRPVSPVHTARRARCSRPPPVPGTHAMALRPSSVPLRVPLPAHPESSLPEVLDPESDRAHAARPTVSHLLPTAVIDPSFESAAASAVVAELLEFAAACRINYATDLVAESGFASPPSVGDFEGDPDALDIPTPRSYAEAITGPYSSQWQAAMDAKMASWKSTGTYVNVVPPPGANIVDGMWIFRVKRSPSSPPAFKARYVARGFNQRQGVEYFHTFSPTPKMTTLRVLLHVAAQRDYKLHSLDFSTAFLQGRMHEEIWLRRPPGFTGSFPAGTQWSLRRPVYGLHQAPREWHDTLRTTLAALGFARSTADPSLFLRTDTSLPPFYVLVYVDDLVFATADEEALTLANSELQKRHICTDLGELRSYLGLQITRDRARRTITLTKSHIVHQVLQRFGFQFSSPQPTPLSTSHSLSAPPSDESVEPSGPYPELVGCLMYLMTCTRPDLAYPLSLLARYVAPGSVSWRSTRSSSVLSSSCEAEIYAGAIAAQELRWLTYVLTNLGEQPRSPPHRGQLRLAYVATRANTADIFTNALPPGDHQRFSTVLGLLALLFLTGPAGASPRLSPQPAPLSKQQLREWFAQRTFLHSGFAGAGNTGAGGGGVTAGAGGTGGVAAAGPRGARTRAGGTGVGDAGAGGAGAGCAGAGGTGAGGPGAVDTGAGGAGARGAGGTGAGGTMRPRSYFVPLLEQTGGLLDHREPASRTAFLVRTGRRVPRPRSPPVPGTHAMAVPLIAELLDFGVACRLDYATALVAESESASPPSVGVECALGTDVLEDRQEDFECLAAAVPRFTSLLLAPKGDPDAPDIPTPRSYAKAIKGPYSSQCQAAMDAKMASWKSTGTYRDYELHSLDFSTDFLQGSLHEGIWLRLPPGFTGLFPVGTQWSLRRPVYGLRQVLQRLGFQFSSPQPTPLSTSYSLSAPPLDESVEPSGPYPELVGCLMYLMTCTRPDLAYPLSLLARYVAPVVLADHADASWVDESATKRSSQGYTFSLGSGSVFWRSTHSSSVLNSSCEAEIYAGAMAAQELRCLTYLLTDLGEQPRSLPRLSLQTYLDNLAAEQDLTGGFRGNQAFATPADEADWDEKNVDGASEEAGPLPYWSVPVSMDDENPRESVNAEVYYDFADNGYVTPQPVNTNGSERIGPNFLPDPEAGDEAGRPIQFDTWLDDLNLYLLSDSRDSVSLFDHTSGAAPAPPTTADSATHSLWLTRDAAARLAICNHLPLAECAHFGQHRTAQTLYDIVVARYSSPTTTALGRLLLPYLFPELSAFATVEDLVSHLRTSDARYCAAAPTEDHFLSLDPIVLTIDLLEQHLLAAESSVVAVGAACGTPRTPFFEGCSPSPLAPSYASAASDDVPGAEDVGATSASAKRRSSKGKGGSGGGGGSSGGGGGSGGGGSGETPSPQQLREWFAQRGASRGSGSCPYVIRTGDHAGQTCGKPHIQHRFAFFDLDYDVILAAMYALSVSAEGDCYLCVLPDPGIKVAALGASESVLPGTAPAEALHTFTHDSDASHCFFRDSTTLTPLSAPVPVRLADPSGGPVLARSSNVLPCPAVPSGSLSGLHLSSFSTNLVSASGQVAPPCSCHLLSHQTLLWHRRLGHPSLPYLRGMHSRLLVSGLPRSLPPLPPSPAPSYLPCVKGRQRAAPHSSSFPPTTAPLQTLHMDVWGPACVSGKGRERYFLLVVDDYTRYTTVFPLRSKGQVVDVLIPWIHAVRLQLRERFHQDLPVLHLHSDKGGEFSSDLLWEFCRVEGILQSFTLPGSPQKNGIAERHIGLVMEVARAGCTSF